ncbi:hypothetical protein DICSQDRAFT_157424 [Dichomitus squalens LYAD-421 SS1]|uniref:Uncharacterized protein n=1 Tax=Dichomitus squalens (strain LYAD-421) TaxID=732165 RepID=R7SN25_DICSQ|nr:uncharacterized protein DICSQDRAFT_157424 [Dichomitus squalens LYAD-421 SS1]EJF57298.1 hypothetical protein DICSQDRAFT_157424 [Dichomitus squalens LYAD-421 SS1]
MARTCSTRRFYMGENAVIFGQAAVVGQMAFPFRPFASNIPHCASLAHNRKPVWYGTNGRRCLRLRTLLSRNSGMGQLSCA